MGVGCLRWIFWETRSKTKYNSWIYTADFLGILLPDPCYAQNLTLILYLWNTGLSAPEAVHECVSSCQGLTDWQEIIVLVSLVCRKKLLLIPTGKVIFSAVWRSKKPDFLQIIYGAVQGEVKREVQVPRGVERVGPPQWEAAGVAVQKHDPENSHPHG